MRTAPTTAATTYAATRSHLDGSSSLSAIQTWPNEKKSATSRVARRPPRTTSRVTAVAITRTTTAPTTDAASGIHNGSSTSWSAMFSANRKRTANAARAAVWMGMAVQCALARDWVTRSMS
jgi:hypothetical protein